MTPLVCFVWPLYTASLAFRHLPPNSAGFGYATEGALFMSALLSTSNVLGTNEMWKQRCVEARTRPRGASAPDKQNNEFRLESNNQFRLESNNQFRLESDNQFRLESNDGFICGGVSNVDGYKRNTWYCPSCLLQSLLLFEQQRS